MNTSLNISSLRMRVAAMLLVLNTGGKITLSMVWITPLLQMMSDLSPTIGREALLISILCNKIKS